MKLRRVLCALGLHSTFEQHDCWGTARVCRYCTFALPTEPDSPISETEGPR